MHDFTSGNVPSAPITTKTATPAVAPRPSLLAPLLAAFVALWLLTACQPTPEGNVLGYLIAQRLGGLKPPLTVQPTGALEGRVMHDGTPVSGASVVVAERLGRPHTAQTDATGRYRIDGIPPGQYAPAAVAPGFDETQLPGLLGTPALVTIHSGETATAPDLELHPYAPPALPDNLAQAVNLRQTGVATATAPFPEGATAEVISYTFDFAGTAIDSLRLYLPAGAPVGQRYPLVLFVAPTAIDDWQNVSVAFASQGYAVVGISPTPARGAEAEAHAQDARVALALARQGALGPAVGDNRPVAMGGSYSSAILARLLRSAGDDLAGWVTVGGLADAFKGAANFYRGELEMPPQFSLLVPAFGFPDLYPLAFLKFSPVYVAAALPPTMIVHTAADRVLPIDQAYDLEAALRVADVPVETYYYTDVSHYLGIGENLTDAGREMFYKILDFVARYGTE